MKYKHRSLLICLVVLVLVAVSFALALSIIGKGSKINGFYEDENGTCYYQNGVPVTSAWIDEAGDRYYFGADGRITTGWVSIDKNKYYFDTDGKMATGWTKIKKTNYYFDENGKMATGWTEIEGADYYFYKNGKMATGWTKIKKVKYYFGADGKMATGWTKIKKDNYYFKSNGRMVTGSKKIDGARYYFDSSGKRQTGWIARDGKEYYYQSDGKMLVGAHKIIGKELCIFDDKGVFVRSVDTTKPMVALTYDDGPSVNTDKILRVLKKNGGRATFFVVGRRVAEYSSSLKKAWKMGCEIGSHTYDHVILTRVDAATIKTQIQKTNKAVKEIIGSVPTVMRPPGGGYNDMVQKIVKVPLVLWSIDTLDWKTRNAPKTISAVLNYVRDGDIVLMHDLYEPTAKASAVIVPELIKRGYQLVTVSELIECRGGVKEGKVYGRLSP